MKARKEHTSKDLDRLFNELAGEDDPPAPGGGSARSEAGPPGPVIPLISPPEVFAEDCTDLAHEYLRKADVRFGDEEVESLAESIAAAILNWFGDMKHLTEKQTKGTVR